MGVSFSCNSNSIIALCLVFFDMVERKSSIMKQIQCKPLGLPSHTQWQTEDKGTTNKLGQDIRITSLAWDTFIDVLLSACLLYVVLHSVERQSGDQLSSNKKNLTPLNNFCKLYDQLFCKLHVIYNIPLVNFAYILKAISTKRNISLSWQPARNCNTSEYRSCPVPADLTPVLVNILLNKILQAEVYCVLNT